MGVSTSIESIPTIKYFDQQNQQNILNDSVKNKTLNRFHVIQHNNYFNCSASTRYSTHVATLCYYYLEKSENFKGCLQTIIACIKMGSNVNKIHIITSRDIRSGFEYDCISSIYNAYGQFNTTCLFIAGKTVHYFKYIKLMRILIHYGLNMTSFFKKSKCYVKNNFIFQKDVELFAICVIRRHRRGKY